MAPTSTKFYKKISYYIYTVDLSTNQNIGTRLENTT